jgi:hypothetical protein
MVGIAYCGSVTKPPFSSVPQREHIGRSYVYCVGQGLRAVLQRAVFDPAGVGIGRLGACTSTAKLSALCVGVPAMRVCTGTRANVSISRACTGLCHGVCECAAMAAKWSGGREAGRARTHARVRVVSDDDDGGIIVTLSIYQGTGRVA